MPLPRRTVVAVLLLVLIAVVVLSFNTRTAQAQGPYSTNAELSAFSLSPGTLDPAFDRLTNSYTASVENPESRITLITTASDAANATVEFLPVTPPGTRKWSRSPTKPPEPTGSARDPSKKGSKGRAIAF